MITPALAAVVGTFASWMASEIAVIVERLGSPCD